MLAEDDISLTARSFAVTLTIDVSGESADAILRLAVAAGRFAVTSTGVSFLDDLLPAEGLVVDVDADLSYSSRDGLTLSGQASLTVARAVGLKLGPLTVNRYELSLGTSGGGIAAGLGVAATLTLGPVELSVAGVGVRATIEPGPGNLGAADLAVRAAPPNGFGVVIDAGVVTGGGFVQRDPTGDYIGALELQLGKIGIKAIGCCRRARRLVDAAAAVRPDPAGADRVRLHPERRRRACSACSTAWTSTQLVGGMRTEAFDDILFPADPVGDAPRILDTAAHAVPACAARADGRPDGRHGLGHAGDHHARLAVLIQLDNVFGRAVRWRCPRSCSSGSCASRSGRPGGPRGPGPASSSSTSSASGTWPRSATGSSRRCATRGSPDRPHRRPGRLGRVRRPPALPARRGRFQPAVQGRPGRQVGGALDRLGAAFSVGPVQPDPGRLLRADAGDDPGRAQSPATAKIGPVGLKGEIGFDVLIYRGPRTHFIADFRVRPPRSPTGGTRWPGSRSPARSRGPAAGTSWARSASRSSGGTSPSPSTSRGAPRHRWSANRSTSARCWPPSWPSRRTGPLSCPAAARPSSRWPRVGGTSRRSPTRSARCVFVQQAVPLGLAMERFGDAEVAGPNQFDVEGVTVGGEVPHGAATLTGARRCVSTSPAPSSSR